MSSLRQSKLLYEDTSRPVSQAFSLSFNQQAVWLEQQLYPSDATNNFNFVAKINQEIDLRIFQKALWNLAKQYEFVRTYFPKSYEKPIRKIDSNFNLELQIIDGFESSERAFFQLLQNNFWRPFNLTNETPLKFYLYSRPGPQYFLQIVSHHIALSFKEYLLLPVKLAQLYVSERDKRDIILPKASASYSQFVLKQYERVGGERFKADQAYWREYLSGELPKPVLPLSKQESAENKSGVRHLLLEDAFVSQLKETGLRCGVKIFSLLTAAFKVLISKYTKEEEIIVGIPNDERRDVENIEFFKDLVGFTTNTLPLRSKLGADRGFDEVCREVSSDIREMSKHRLYPLSMIMEDLREEKGNTFSELFKILVVSQQTDEYKEIASFGVGQKGVIMNVDGFKYESIGIGFLPVGRFDLVLAIVTTAQGYVLSFHYNELIFEEESIERLSKNYLALLESIVKNPSQKIKDLSVLSEDEKQLQLVDWNQTQAHFKDDFLERFEKHVQLTPEADAIIFDDHSMSYSKLNDFSNQLAAYLVNLGIKPDSLVGIGLERSFNLVVSLLGVLKAGCGYLPMDPELPVERLNFMLEDSQAEILITQQSLTRQFDSYTGRVVFIDTDWDKIAEVNTCINVQGCDPNQLAYVIYTSGSTGRPKGVEIPRKALDNLLFSMQQQIDMTSKDRWLAITTVSFDISHLEFLLPLCQGATVVIANKDIPKDPHLLAHAIEKHRITYAQATPSTWQMLIDFGWKGNSSLKILCGGENLSQALANQLFKLSHSLWNMYGPTETTIWSSIKKIDGDSPKVTLGRPLANTNFYVLDDNRSLLPIGVIGELYIGGYGVARGYRNRPELTFERFQPTFAQKLYKTGDLVRYLPNGELEFIGRGDGQVKIHGYRIELGEIEESIKKCPKVQQAIVILHGELLIAYYKGNVAVNEIKERLSSCLPSYMIPSQFINVKEFNLNFNGKIDRKALPQPSVFKDDQVISPENPIENEVLEIFKSLLGQENIGTESNFFALGGHSLLAARVISRINKTFHIELPLKTLLEKPTVKRLSKEVKLFLSKIAASSQVTLIPRDGSLPLSYSQQRIWFLDHQAPNSALYSIPFVIEFEGLLNIDNLQKAFDAIIQRHEILRTKFVEVNECAEHRLLKTIETSIERKDFSTFELPENMANDLIFSEAQKPFQLDVGPLFRSLLIRISNTRHFFFLNFHHIIFDGYSVNLFLEELSAIYQGLESGHHYSLQSIEIQYIDYANWDSSRHNDSAAESQISWWQSKLDNVPFILNLPTDKPRPPIQTHHGEMIEFRIVDHFDTSELKKIAKKNETTLFVVMLAAFHVLLYRYTGQNDFVVGVPVSNREQRSCEPLIGCFVNTLPLRTTSSSTNSFFDLLENIKITSIESFEHQDVPFEKIVEKLKIERTLSHSPLFQVMFNMLPETNEKCFKGHKIQLRHINRGSSHFDISFSVQEGSDGLVGLLEYNTDLFYKDTIERMIKHFNNLVQEVIQDSARPIGKLSLLSQDEIQQQVIDWNEQLTIYANNRSMIEQIEDRSQATPDAVALVFEGKKYTYSQINQLANQVAHSLLNMGLKAEDKVIICLERSAEFIPAMLGVLKAGGAYVPVDPSEPIKRINAILQDVKPLCILSHSATNLSFSIASKIFIDQLNLFPTSNPNILIPKEQLAYIIFTSGSTGNPKGVEVEHKSIEDRVFWKNAAYPLNQQEAVLHTYSFIFDGSIVNYFWPLCAGATLIIASKSEQLDFRALLKLIQTYQVTTIDLLPSLLHGLLEDEEIMKCPSLKNVFSGGEALTTEVVRLFYERCSGKLYNTYGPTEATVESSVWECSPSETGVIAPIGKPIAGAKLYVLDRDQNIAPIGVHGELHIGGIGLARGYLNTPQLTEEKFVKLSVNNGTAVRLYRTGDLVKYKPCGNIEFLGRIDNQVKIRGFRIDISEIETALMHMDPVEKSVVVVKGDHLQKRIVAYVMLSIPMQEATFLKLMKHYLKDRLPNYMIPQQVVVVENFPTLLNGKINIKALPEPYSKQDPSIERASKNKIEQELLHIWKELLGYQQLTITDNFFEAGGNSLLAMRLVIRMKKTLGLSLSLNHLFQYPTIEELAENLNLINREKPWTPLVTIQAKGHKRPFFCIHPVGGNVLCYNALAKHWVEDRPFYAIQAKGLENGQLPHESIEIMAREYIQAIREVQPAGPYLIGGWSFGGLIAVEMVHQLRGMGEKISLLVLVDTSANIEQFKKINIEDEALLLSELTDRFIVNPLKTSSPLSFKESFVNFIENGGKKNIQKEGGMTDRLIALAKANYRALQSFAIPKIDVPVALIRTENNIDASKDYGWRQYAANLKIYDAPGDHWAITQDDHAQHYSKILQKCFNALEKKVLIKIT